MNHSRGSGTSHLLMMKDWVTKVDDILLMKVKMEMEMMMMMMRIVEVMPLSLGEFSSLSPLALISLPLIIFLTTNIGHGC
ncbi:hypothetical protein F7725_000038 [Dissostichus mawsoni]|uniref:Uncharacterized protein n=1 Tax=Dissostichus mawsoni TaxID=36200 RepID=A0A7J5ZHH4_DISMA|nr:hypothetical protein F7725_000038 [Dissostichus mawsoni]